MDLRLTEPQKMLQQQARDFLAKECPKSLVRQMAKDRLGHDPSLWRKMAELGWMGLAFPDEYGGSFLDLTILLEEMGRACVPGPYFSTVVLCGLSLMDAGSKTQKKELLPRIASGDLIMAFALTEPSACWDASGIATRAVAENGHYIINGVKLFVSDAGVAGSLICAARTSDRRDPKRGITLFLVDAKAPSIKCTPLSTIGVDKQCEVILSNMKAAKGDIVGKQDQGWDTIARALERGAVGKCADMVGNAAAALEMSVSYAKERVQFGRPIGSFQAIQHYCANMAVDVDASRLITYHAAWMISEGLPCAMEVSTAKNWVNEACQRVVILGHQIHGGIGFCDDHDMHLFYRNVRGDSLNLGDTASHQKVVARELLSERAFFPDL